MVKSDPSTIEKMGVAMIHVWVRIYAYKGFRNLIRR